MTTTKRNATTHRNHRTNHKKINRILAIAIIAVIAIALSYLTIIAAQYCFHSWMCNWAESEGNAMRYTATGLRNWTDFDIAWYNEEIALKQAFIESNAIAGFYNAFSGNVFLKFIRLVMWTAIGFFAGLNWYLLYCIANARYRSYQKRAMHKAMNQSYTENVIKFKAIKKSERKSYTHAGYIPSDRIAR